MSRATQTRERELPIPNFEAILATGDGAADLAVRVEMAQATRALSKDFDRRLDHLLLERLARYHLGLEQARELQGQLQEMVQRLDAPPWFPALFLRTVDTDVGPRAVVLFNGQRRLVAVAEQVDLASLLPGHEIFLGQDLNVVTGTSPNGAPRCGETASFERLTGDGRCILRWRDEEVVVDAGGELATAELRSGDQVRWDRAAWMALERLERAEGRRFLLDEVPAVGRECVGGQDGNLDLLLSALTAALAAPEKAARYGLNGRNSILMVGPSGVGKTLMARVAAAEVTRLRGSRCRFAVVKPAEWESPWVGETQQNIRNCFEALRGAAAEGSALLFLDEIEAVGRIRGGVSGHHSDKFLAALLAELDGFADRSGVAIIAATNRKDLVDPALLERLSDVEITVRRPDMRGARAIFDVHLPESLPYHANGSSAAAARREMIDGAVSLLYAPNADNELCTLRLRDGKTRVVAARELASGRLIDQICRGARRAAFLRDVRSDDAGLREGDVLDAAHDAIERLATTLTPRNAHAYLTDLPQDIDVVSVEPIERKTRRRHRYLRAPADAPSAGRPG